MKRKLCALFFALMLAATALSGCGASSDGLTKVRLSEVAHSIFYAPDANALLILKMVILKMKGWMWN